MCFGVRNPRERVVRKSEPRSDSPQSQTQSRPESPESDTATVSQDFTHWSQHAAVEQRLELESWTDCRFRHGYSTVL